ncbi:hypothetical protein ACFWP1_33360 [Streptomyces sp. NPDC058425]
MTATTNGSAASLLHHLEGALKEAAFVATVRPDGPALKLVLHSSKYPYNDTAEAATEWLTDAGIDATAALDEETFRVVITLRTAEAVRALIETLLRPWITAHTVAQQLTDVLSDHSLDSTVDVTTASLTLDLADDDELSSAVALAGLLGAPAFNTSLRRRRDLRRFGERLSWLITGATGSPVLVEVEPGCAHQVDHVTVRLSLGQAARLTRRLAQAEPADPSVRLQRLIGAVAGEGVWVEREPGRTSGGELLTISLSPEQGRRLMNHLTPDRDGDCTP